MHFCHIFTSIAVPTKKNNASQKKNCSFMAYYTHTMQLNRLQVVLYVCCCLIYPARKSHLHGTTNVLIIKYFIGLTVSAKFLVIACKKHYYVYSTCDLKHVFSFSLHCCLQHLWIQEEFSNILSEFYVLLQVKCFVSNFNQNLIWSTGFSKKFPI